MKNLKNKFILASAILALASCADNSYLGPETGENGTGGGAISFGYELPSVTRGEETDGTAAATLGFTFQVYGTKTVNDGTNDVISNVFAQNTYSTSSNTPYWVWYVAGTSQTTNSNSAGWEYVGAAGSHGTSGSEVTLTNEQFIKYWDFKASQYDFVAFKAKTPASGTAIVPTNITTNGFTITSATPAQLAALYIADKKTILSSNNTEFGKEVNFKFRNSATKVRLGIYEIIPGYQVKNVKFHYTNNGDKVSPTTSEFDGKTHAFLDGKFVGSSSSTATFTVSYDNTDDKKAVLTPSSSTNEFNTTFFDFGEFSSEAIGETSTAPTWANASVSDHYISVFPNTEGTNIDDMTLKVSYTLYNTTTQETINIGPVSAVVPKAYMTWKPNFAYTYLFKITDKELTPITLDAIVIDDGDGHQETITTVPSEDNSDVSITTYQNGLINTSGDFEYNEKTIYVAVQEGTFNPFLAVNDNAKLYTATIEAGAVQTITEASVANALANGTKDNESTPTTWTVKDANGKDLVVTAITGLESVTQIPATDSPTKSDLTINVAKFTPSVDADTYYVFEYTTVYRHVTSGTINTEYYTIESTTYTHHDAPGVAITADGSQYIKNTGTDIKKYYKVIKVKNSN